MQKKALGWKKKNQWDDGNFRSGQINNMAHSKKNKYCSGELSEKATKRPQRPEKISYQYIVKSKMYLRRGCCSKNETGLVMQWKWRRKKRRKGWALDTKNSASSIKHGVDRVMHGHCILYVCNSYVSEFG